MASKKKKAKPIPPKPKAADKVDKVEGDIGTEEKKGRKRIRKRASKSDGPKLEGE